jgi:hypothetical protein
MDVGLCDSAVAGAPAWLPLLLRRLKLCDGAALASTDRSPAQRRRVSGHNVAFCSLPGRAHSAPRRVYGRCCGRGLIGV